MCFHAKACFALQLSTVPSKTIFTTCARRRRSGGQTAPVAPAPQSFWRPVGTRTPLRLPAGASEPGRPRQPPRRQKRQTWSSPGRKRRSGRKQREQMRRRRTRRRAVWSSPGKRSGDQRRPGRMRRMRRRRWSGGRLGTTGQPGRQRRPRAARSCRHGDRPSSVPWTIVWKRNASCWSLPCTHARSDGRGGSALLTRFQTYDCEKMHGLDMYTASATVSSMGTLDQDHRHFWYRWRCRLHLLCGCRRHGAVDSQPSARASAYRAIIFTADTGDDSAFASGAGSAAGRCTQLLLLRPRRCTAVGRVLEPFCNVRSQ